jgi:anti-sigma regulatory factor (Ser/Thr protein kinase)
MILELQATPQEVMRAVEALQEFAREKGLPEKEIFGLALALEECGSNIVDHAYKRDAGQKFQVRIEHTATALIIELRDRGPKFDPTAPRVEPPPDGAEVCGGWGAPLVRHYIDEISYRREGGENVLQLTKRLVESSPRNNAAD